MASQRSFLRKTVHRATDPLIASAADGSVDAIQQLSKSQDNIGSVVQHRLAPLVAAHSFRHGIEVPESWKRETRRSAATRVVLDLTLAEFGQTLDRLQIPWLPIKGMGPVASYYPAAECRPTSDLDVIIDPRHLATAKLHLMKTGWIELDEKEHSALTSSYNWSARHSTGALLEAHFTLWGYVDPHFASGLMERSTPSETPGSFARCLSAVDCYLVAATHLWNVELPRPLLDFVDLHLLSAGATEAFAHEVVDLARLHDLQLPVGLASTIQSSLWGDPIAHVIAAALVSDLRYAERAALWAHRGPSADLSLPSIVFGRLLSFRKSRTGWLAPVRFLARSFRRL